MPSTGALHNLPKATRAVTMGGLGQRPAQDAPTHDEAATILRAPAAFLAWTVGALAALAVLSALNDARGRLWPPTVRAMHRVRLLTALVLFATVAWELPRLRPSDAPAGVPAVCAMHAAAADAWAFRYSAPPLPIAPSPRDYCANALVARPARRAYRSVGAAAAVPRVVPVGPPASRARGYGVDDSAVASIPTWLGYYLAELAIGYVLDGGASVFQTTRDVATLFMLSFTALTRRAGAVAVYAAVARAALRPLEDGARHVRLAFRLPPAAAVLLSQAAHVATAARGTLLLVLVFEWSLTYMMGRHTAPRVSKPGTQPSSDASHAPELGLMALAAADLLQFAVGSYRVRAKRKSG